MQGNLDFTLTQYDNDTLIIMKDDARQLFFLKAMLNSFSEPTGLRMNYSKSIKVPINILEERYF
jgi:hypothetical protein